MSRGELRACSKLRLAYCFPCILCFASQLVVIPCSPLCLAGWFYRCRDGTARSMGGLCPLHGSGWSFHGGVMGLEEIRATTYHTVCSDVNQSIGTQSTIQYNNVLLQAG
jgi:hypothetical protein